MKHNTYKYVLIETKDGKKSIIQTQYLTSEEAFKRNQNYEINTKRWIKESTAKKIFSYLFI